jgi:hypothetical protein
MFKDFTRASAVGDVPTLVWAWPFEWFVIGDWAITNSNKITSGMRFIINSGLKTKDK